MRRDEAHALLDRAVGLTSDVGLPAEQMTPGGEMPGNVPQGLSHLALVDAAVTLRGRSR